MKHAVDLTKSLDLSPARRRGSIVLKRWMPAWVGMAGLSMIASIIMGFMLTPLARAQTPPVREMAELNYVNTLHALLNLEKFKPDDQDYLDAYSMIAHCDVVHGSFNNEFRWNQAREAVKKWIALNKKKRPTRLSVKSQIMFTRYDFNAKYYLFSDDTKIQKVNSFPTETRPLQGVCDKPIARILPAKFLIVTNNPVTLPGLRLNEQQAQDLKAKFESQGNKHYVAWIRFNIDITDSDYIGPSIYKARPQGDGDWIVKASLHSIEFFSDPRYRNRFYYYVPL